MRFEYLEKLGEGVQQHWQIQFGAQIPIRRHNGLLAPTLGKGFVKFPLKFCDCAVEGENFPGKYMLLGQESGALNPRAVIHFPGRQNGHFERSEVPTISLYQPG